MGFYRLQNFSMVIIILIIIHFKHLAQSATAGVVPNSAPCQIMHPLVLVGLGLGVGEGLGLGVGLGLGNQVAISTRGCIIWQGCRFRHNTGRLN